MIIYFTKAFADVSIEEIGAVAQRLGLDGMDVAIRKGHSVNPSNVREALPRAMEIWSQAGLSVPLVTLEVTATDPDNPALQTIFETCGRVGIPYIKLGYWFWTPERHYWEEVKRIREDIAKLQKLGEKHGVCSLVHTHSGHYYSVNASAIMHLLQGFDPRYIGVYFDPAHLALDGEQLPMAMDIVRDYLKFVAVKNSRSQRATEKDARQWTAEWCPLAEGVVNWPVAMQILRKGGYEGPWSLHAEYSAIRTYPAVLEPLTRDVEYFKRECLSGVG